MEHLLAAALLITASAQALSGDMVLKQLNAQDAQTIAWGAYNAGAYQRIDAIPRLQQLLESPPASPLRDRGALTDVVMDALIQLKAKLPTHILVPYVGTHPVQALILLSNATDREAALLDLLPRLTGDQWFAAANVLFQDGSPGLVEHVVRGVKLRLTIYVADDENVGYGTGEGVEGGVSCGIGENPRGYPPHAEYRIIPSHTGAVVLSVGPKTVYYLRTVFTDFQYPVSTAESPVRDDDRLIYLHAMASRGGNVMPLRAHTSETVVWTDADTLVRRAQAARLRVERHFRALVQAARQLHPSTDNAIAIPSIEMDVVDGRSHKSSALPQIDR